MNDELVHIGKGEEINEFASRVQEFFNYFDLMFLIDGNSEQLLSDTLKSLKDKINRNKSALPLIIAMGGHYESGIDRAKIDEVESLLNLLKARKKLRVETQTSYEKQKNNLELLSLFGI